MAHSSVGLQEWSSPPDVVLNILVAFLINDIFSLFKKKTIINIIDHLYDQFLINLSFDFNNQF